MDADLRPSLGDDNPSFRADGVNLDFADVRMARRADAPDAKRADDAVFKFQRNSGKVVDMVVDKPNVRSILEFLSTFLRSS